MIPENKVLVIGDKVGEFITYGPVTEQSYEDMKVIPAEYNIQIWQQFGLIVGNAQGIHVLEVA